MPGFSQANAIVVARVREDELSSTTAVIGMLQRTCTLVSSAVMLSMVGAFGASQGEAASSPAQHLCLFLLLRFLLLLLLLLLLLVLLLFLSESNH